ncbi:MAG: serine hydrolase domain-containing protein [Paraglaciecola sp.]|uniref:serine hydrolase domain-containing protein n=2 Tax=Paraglaciecola sp. TaxID=1920173 RepID=UPI0032645A74
MKKNVYLFLFICLFSVSAQGFDKAKLDQYLDALDANQKAMLSLAIVKDGEPVYQKSIGYTDVASKQKPNIDTQYHIGSITKVFTSTMIFQLIDEGKLSLDTKLAKYYPKVKNANKITISMLLNHRSGIYNFTNAADYIEYMEQPKAKAEMVSLIEGLGSDFEPDSQASYSNSAYVLLGFIIEDITQDSYANQLQNRVVAKLNLDRTMFAGPIDVEANQANSYTYESEDWVPATQTDMSIPHGAGAIISTLSEIGKFLTGLFNGKLVSANSLDKMKEVNQGYGRGLFKFPFYEKEIYGHSGGIDGFVSQAGYFPADNVAFTLTSNGLNYKLNDISIGLLSIYYGRPFDIPDFTQKPISLSEKNLLKYEGVFSSKDIPLKITLKFRDGQLTAQATGQGPLSLTPFSHSEFRFEPAGIVMRFELDGEKVDYATFQLKQGGGTYKFSKE